MMVFHFFRICFPSSSSFAIQHPPIYILGFSYFSKENHCILQVIILWHHQKFHFFITLCLFAVWGYLTFILDFHFPFSWCYRLLANLMKYSATTFAFFPALTIFPLSSYIAGLRRYSYNELCRVNEWLKLFSKSFFSFKVLCENVRTLMHGFCCDTIHTLTFMPCHMPSYMFVCRWKAYRHQPQYIRVLWMSKEWKK